MGEGDCDLNDIGRAWTKPCRARGKAGSSSLRSSECQSLQDRARLNAVPLAVQFADRLVVAVMPLWLTPMIVMPLAKVVARPAWTGALAMVATVGTVELQ
jgi:hypothetical protein